MIDYEKLALVHKLYPQGYLKIIPIFDKSGELECMNYSMEIENVMPDYFHDIDDLINYLRKSEPKYKPNDLVFYSNDDSVCCFTVSIATWSQEHNEFVYGYHGDYSYRESALFPTRQELIEHQIKYWQEMLSEELEQHVSDYCVPKFEGEIKGFGYDGYKIIPDAQRHQPQVDADRCQHVSDGNIYCSNPPQNKCIKCGEFYR